MWVEIRNHRNKVIFKGGLVDAEKIFNLAQLKGWFYLKFKMKRITSRVSGDVLTVFDLESFAAR